MKKQKIKTEINYLQNILAVTFGTGLTEAGIRRLAKLKGMLTILFIAASLIGNATGTHCTSTTKTGAPCKAWAQKGTDKCFAHNTANYCKSNKKDGTPCHAQRIKGSDYCTHHQPKTK